MKKLIFTVLVSFSLHSFALDISKYKEQIRGHMNELLGKNITSKVLGVPPNSNQNTMTLPNIPDVKLNAKDESFFNKKTGKAFTQGQKYNSLTNDQKRKYRVSFLNQLYFVTRNNEAKESEIVKSLNVLEQGGNREGVYRSITLDQSYLALESYSEVPSDTLVNFVQYFPPKYLKKRYQKSSIQKLNLWALKRLLTEKCLELIDVLAFKEKDLYRWYAVFSAEIATNYPSLWKSKTRKATSDKYHYKWAQTVPLQHIKSEVIIKMHTLMNHLNNQ